MVATPSYILLSIAICLHKNNCGKHVNNIRLREMTPITRWLYSASYYSIGVEEMYEATARLDVYRVLEKMFRIPCYSFEDEFGLACQMWQWCSSINYMID